MYLPPQFASTREADALALIDTYPFAALVTTDDSGVPVLSHLPLVTATRTAPFVLIGHMARANTQWQHLQARGQALVSFLGPHAYMSPAVYPDRERVPTWNYLELQCHVRARLRETASETADALAALIARSEPAYQAQWQSLSAAYQSRMMAGIVAFDLVVESWQCKLKLNQHRPESHAALARAYAGGDEGARALAAWMGQLGIG